MVMRARSLTCTAIVIPSRACVRPRQRPGTLLTRPAYGSHKSSSNPVHSSALRLRNTSADLRVQPAYSKPLGGMGVNVDDGVDVDDRCGAAAACAIGPEGPIIVRPEGRTACCYGTPEGVLLRTNDGSCAQLYYLYSRRLQTSGHNQSLRHVVCA